MRAIIFTNFIADYLQHVAIQIDPFAFDFPCSRSLMRLLSRTTFHPLAQINTNIAMQQTTHHLGLVSNCFTFASKCSLDPVSLKLCLHNSTLIKYADHKDP